LGGMGEVLCITPPHKNPYHTYTYTHKKRSWWINCFGLMPVRTQATIALYTDSLCVKGTNACCVAGADLG
jgi:hypothetical protein